MHVVCSPMVACGERKMARANSQTLAAPFKANGVRYAATVELGPPPRTKNFWPPGGPRSCDPWAAIRDPQRGRRCSVRSTSSTQEPDRRKLKLGWPDRTSGPRRKAHGCAHPPRKSNPGMRGNSARLLALAFLALLSGTISAPIHNSRRAGGWRHLRPP